MKRIILGLSILLMLVQSGFAETDAEWDQKIQDAPNQTVKEMYRCNKVSGKTTSSLNICINAAKLLKLNYPNEKQAISATLLNVGFSYEHNEKNYIKAYEYFMESAKLNNTKAQKNLDILCRQHSWVCK